jgi:hypothetical protein
MLMQGTRNQKRARPRRPRPWPPEALYIHFGTFADTPRRLLSIRFTPGQQIRVDAGNNWGLWGQIRIQGTRTIAEVYAATSHQTGYYEGTVALDRPFLPEVLSVTPSTSRMWLLVSRTSDHLLFLDALKEAQAKLRRP